MSKELIIIFLYAYLFSMISMLIYYLYAHWSAIYIARQYGMEVTNFDINTTSLLIMACPLVNTITTIILWLQIGKTKKDIEQTIILSMHPNLRDPPEDKDIW